MNTETAYYRNLTGIMLTTRGTRFTAATSLTFRDRFSIVTVALLSVYLIGLSVVLLAAPESIGSEGAKFFSILSIVASIWILVISLFDYALGRGVLAHRLQQNAIRITLIAREMERELEKVSPDFEQLRLLAARYEQEVAETQVNHSTSDYKMYMFSRQKASGPLGATILSGRNLLYSILVFCWSVPADLIVLVIVCVATIWYVTK
jgi:hypothetical protein